MAQAAHKHCQPSKSSVEKRMAHASENAVQPQGNAVVESCCSSCGVSWAKHKGVYNTCRDLKSARKQLTELRILFFVLCLKHLPPEAEFTPDNLLIAMLKK